MISIGRHMDGYDIAQEVRLERRVHKGSFLLLEGDTDIKRFGKFIDDTACSLVNCYGRRKAIEAITLLYDEGFPGAVGIVDADFDRVRGLLKEHEGLIYSRTHDLDLDWATPAVVERYLVEVGDTAKCDAHGGATAVIERIISGLKPISVARFLNSTRQVQHKLSHVDAGRCFMTFAVDVDGYIELVFEGVAVQQLEKVALKEVIARAQRREFDLYQLTNGHDLHCALGASLRDELGSRRTPQSWGSEVEMHLRLTFGDEDFKNTTVYRDICMWVQDNKPYIVLHSRLNS